MLIRSKLTILIAVLLLSLLLPNCSDDKSTSPKSTPDNRIEITGQVYLYRCWSKDDVQNNPPGRDYRYSYRTGETARVSFVDTTSGSATVSICDSTGFTVRLDSGLYDIIVETGSSYPDTLFAVPVTAPDTLSLDIFADWEPSSRFYAHFSYHPPADSLGEAAEREWLQTVAQTLGDNLLDVKSAVRDEVFIIGDWSASVQYMIRPTDHLSTWKVVARIQECDTILDSLVPAYRFGIGPGLILCFARKE